MNKEAKKILIVDDDASHRIMIKATVVEYGYGKYEAGGSNETIDMVGKRFFSL